MASLMIGEANRIQVSLERRFGGFADAVLAREGLCIDAKCQIASKDDPRGSCVDGAHVARRIWCVQLRSGASHVSGLSTRHMPLALM
jgi:hypothetical protein